MKLSSPNLKQAGYVRNTWRIKPQEGATIEDICKPEYWAHVAKMFRAGDIIEVVPENGSYFAELFVRSVGDVDVNVAQLRLVEFDKKDAKEFPGFIISHTKGTKWRVQRESDKEVLTKGHETREEAEAFVESLIAETDPE